MPKRRVVGLVQDDAFSESSVVGAPIVANGGGIEGGVLAHGKGIGGAAVSIVVQHVTSPVIGCTHVDMVAVNGGNAPEVSGDGVVADTGVAGGVVAVDGDAAAAVHRVGFQVVINDVVLFNEHSDVGAVLGESVAIVKDAIAAQHSTSELAAAHQVRDGDAAAHIAGHAFDGVALDEDGVGAASAEVELRCVGIIEHIVVESAVENLRRRTCVGGRVDGGGAVVVEVTGDDPRVAVHHPNRRLHKSRELAANERHIAMRQEDVLAVLEPDLLQGAGGSVFETEFVRLGAGVVEEGGNNERVGSVCTDDGTGNSDCQRIMEFQSLKASLYQQCVAYGEGEVLQQVHISHAVGSDGSGIEFRQLCECVSMPRAGRNHLRSPHQSQREEKSQYKLNFSHFHNGRLR